MKETTMNPRKELIDLLVAQFWADGYKIIHRLFGNYVTEPPLIGEYRIDILARRGNRFAIGLILQEKDFENSDLPRMIDFLGTRRSKFANADAPLYIGVEPHLYVKLASLLRMVSPTASKNVRSFPLQLIPEVNLFTAQQASRPTASSFFR
jgi:hypothetical protein